MVAGYAPRLVRAAAADVAFVPPLAIGSVPDTCVVRLTPESVPPRVKEPDDVTVPLSVRPFTVPVPLTEVTVPLPVPAPIALRKVAASKAETVLSALKRGNVTADGLVIVKRLSPSVVEPSDVRAPEAVVAFVPPLAIGSVPETCVVRLTPESVPPRVRLPLVVTVPVSVIPLTVPVPLTEETDPLPVPTATPLTYSPVALIVPEPCPPPVGDPTCKPPVGLSDVISVFAPEAAAPRFVRAFAADVAPVPPFATANSVPDQFELLIDDSTAREPRPRLVRASAAVEAPVPPSATARSVIPVIEPPVMVTAFEFCVEIVPRPRLVRAPEAVLEPVPPEVRARAVPSVSDVR